MGHSDRRSRSRSRDRSRTDGRYSPSASRGDDRPRYARREGSRQRHTSRSRSRSRTPHGTTSHRPGSRSLSRSPKRRRSPSRSRSRGRDDRDHQRKRKRSRSHSVSSTSSTSSYHKHRHHKRDKHHKRSSRSRERKEKKKKKKEKKKKHRGSDGSRWGKYGVISEIDMFAKDPEFRTWLVEERKINPETITKEQRKKEFARFVEDYNTATLPHDKYYNMEAYEKNMSALRAGEFVPPPDDAYDPAADMRAHQSRLKKQAVEQESYLTKEQLEELRQVQRERNTMGRMKILGMDVKQNMGIRMDGTAFDE